MGDAVFLDRQNVNCGQSYLSSFQLKTSEYYTRIKYDYNCCSVSDASVSCYDDSTLFNSDGHGNAFYLDRHTVKCRPDYGLASFKLERNGEDLSQWRYNFKCCMSNTQ